MHAELCGPLGADFYCGSSGTPERFAWLQKPEAQMVQPSPNFVFANSTVSGHLGCIHLEILVPAISPWTGADGGRARG